MHALVIRPVLNGWIVEVGCQTIVFTDTDKMLGDLRKYLADPAKFQKDFMEREGFNSKYTLPGMPQAAQPINIATQAPMEATGGAQTDRGLARY